ncbi:hypothetical protein V5O48_018094 [Marasmius crinis-equi]|uniref:Uncharacterized protein n=1 Tax=Marasmius crinis-equi TaxID=585013 RepID=A0ABR3EMA0_9AGAR
MEQNATKELKKSVKASLRDERARRRTADKAEQKEREKKEREERKAREREEERQALLDIVKDLPKSKGKGKAPVKGSATASSSALPSPSKSVSSEEATILEDEIESASDWSPPPLHELVQVWDQEIADKRKGKAPAKASASTSSSAVPSPSKSASSRKATTFDEEIESVSDWSPPLKARKQETAVQTPSSPTLVASSSPSKLSEASTAGSSSKIQGESSTPPKRARVAESSKKRALEDTSSNSTPAKRARWALEIMDDGSFVEIPLPDSPKAPRSKRRVSASTKEDGDFIQSLHQ